VARPERETVLATPIGDGRFALVTSAASTLERGESIDVRFASGALGSGTVLTRGELATVIELAAAERGYIITRRRPAPNEVVTVMSDPPVAVALSSISDVDVGEGTAIFDDRGALVGLCSLGHEGEVQVIDVSEAVAAAAIFAP